MGRARGKRKRPELQASSSQADQQQNGAILPLLHNLDLPTFRLTSSKTQERPRLGDESLEIRDGDGDADAADNSGEWQTVPSKRPSKKQKLSSKESKNYPHIGPATQLKLQNKIKINDLQALVLYLTADGTAPQWVAVRHYNQVRRVVVVMVPGLERGMFDGGILLGEGCHSGNLTLERGEVTGECMAVEVEGPVVVADHEEGQDVGLEQYGKLGRQSHLTVDVKDNKERLYSSPDSYYPVALSENILPKPLKPLAGIFPHLWPVLTPGDDKYSRISSPIHSMLTSPLPKTREEKKAKGGINPPVAAKNWVNRRTPISEFIATLDELRENEYVLHPALLESAEEKVAVGNQRRAAKESIDDGWVDSRVEKLEDGIADPRAIEGGSVTQGREVLAMDCEMCKTEGGNLDLTRISIVGWDGEVVLDELVKPEKAVIDYLTP
jgi:RNA exonuclease 1